MKSLAIIWAQFGPYHLARLAGLRSEAGTTTVHAIEFSDQTRDYLWQRNKPDFQLHTLVRGAASEQLSFWQVFFRTRQKLAELEAQVCLLPSYWPKQSLAALLAAKSLGLRTVMMNETHAGTARALGWKAGLKRKLLALFDAGLVGGRPQARYFEFLGLPADNLFTGYDAVDNDYFAQQADTNRLKAADVRKAYRLPDNYFLSLGRFVRKKNLQTLITGYSQYLNSNERPKTHLVMVGSGPEEPALKYLCHELGLAVYEKASIGKEQSNPSLPRRTEAAGVHFYGFRQIQENPIFYALAKAFVLPSFQEEWGLVVNEAMASGLPVIVSQTAGCAEDLLEPLEPDSEAFGTENKIPRDSSLRSRVRLNGFVFTPECPRELASILCVLDKDPQLCQAMGQNSRRIVEKFTCVNFGRNAVLAARQALRSSDRCVRDRVTSLRPR